jgi:hypothetical protein
MSLDFKLLLNTDYSKFKIKWISKIKKAFPYCQRSFGFKETFELYHDENWIC